MLLAGQTVYTVNAKTNNVDSWQSVGALKSKGEILIHLVNGKKYCFLPKRFVFDSLEKAQAVAASNK